MEGMARWAALGGLVVLGCGGGGETVTDAGHFVADGGGSDAAGDVVGDTATAVDAAHDGSGVAGEGGAEAAAPAKLVAYASGYGPSIQWLNVDPGSGALTPAGSVTSFGSAPSFLAVDAASSHLFAVDEDTPGRVGAYAIDPATGALTYLNAVSSGGDGPPFVTVAPQPPGSVLVANYGSGTVAVLPVGAGGSLGAATDTQSAGALAHMILPDPSGRFVFVPCKGADYVAQYVLDAAAGKLTPNAVPHVATPTGAGPRHLAFHPGGATAYLINETASTMTALAFDATAGTLTPKQTVSTLPPGFTGTNTAAEVHVHPSGKWLFGSNRGDDSIVVFSLDAAGAMTVHGFTKTGGTTPRDFALDPSGTFLYAANEGTGDVVTFRFDAIAGTLTATGNTVSVPQASFVGVFPLP
jgi:6-phosphogluconolactonase